MLRNPLIGIFVRKCLVISAMLAFLFHSPDIYAEERTDSLSLMIYFRQNQTTIEPDYNGNRMHMDGFVSGVKEIMSDPACRIQGIYIRSGASPEGKFDHNYELSRKRGRNLRIFLQNALMLPADKFVVDAVGEDWAALKDIVERTNVPDRDDILDILDDYIWYIKSRPTSVIGGPKEKLMNLNGGRTWNWLLINVFPELRNAGNTVVCRYSRVEKTEKAALQPQRKVNDTIVFIHKYIFEGIGKDVCVEKDTTAKRGPDKERGAEVAEVAEAAEEMVTKEKERIMAIRTNLLLPLMNIGVEYPISKHWSLEADWNYPWIWPRIANKDCIEMLSLSVGARWWMRKPADKTWRGRTDLAGPSLGISMLAGYYDFERDYSGRQGEFCGLSLDFTWAVRLGKKKLTRMEFTVGGGYLYTPSRKYHVEQERGKLLYDTREGTHWLGPTRAAVSIVFPLSRKARHKQSPDENELR